MLALLLSFLGLAGIVGSSKSASAQPLVRDDSPPVTPDVETTDPGTDQLPDIITPIAPTGNDSDNDNTTDADPLGPTANGAAITGRVQTFDFEDDSIVSIKLLTDPSYGNVTVNPDNTLAVVLTGQESTDDITFDVSITYDDGSTITQPVALEVSEGLQGGGWGVGDHYMLETDDENSVVVEHGENHQKVYISGSDDALTLAEIAEIEGMSVDDVTKQFLIGHSEYGRSPDIALAEDAGMRLWNNITGEQANPSSNWLLIERGYTYEKLDDAFENGTVGESEINPVLIGAYGEGEDPIITGDPRLTGLGFENVVVQGLHFSDGFTSLKSENLIFDDVNFSGSETNIQNAEGITFHEISIVDAVDDEAKDGETWSPHGDRESGIYIQNSNGVLIQDSFFDHNGWESNYVESGDADFGQAPTIYSHNVYLQRSNEDVTFRDNISMRAASFGAQIRPGGFIEDNVFVDNNAGVNFLMGYDTDPENFSGNYTLFTDNLVTSGAHKVADEGQGGLTLGISAASQMASLVDNIVTHLADPNNADELAEKPVSHRPVDVGDGIQTHYNDTIIYNWTGGENAAEGNVRHVNIDGLNTDVLDETTIQLFAAQLLGDPDATIADLADYLRAQAAGNGEQAVDADLILDFFQTGFGLSADDRTESETLRFVPNDLGEGMRWDNRLNWNTEDLPGAANGDSVDLAGNWVVYGGTTHLEDLDFGDEGRLVVTHGYLEVHDHVEVGEGGAWLGIDNAGQFWTDGYTDMDTLTIAAGGGRFANTDLFTGTVDMTLFDNAQAILATNDADFALNGDSKIEIAGRDVKVGFDGEDGGTAVLMLAEDSELTFTSVDNSDLSTIREFHSGHYAETDVQSGVNLGSAQLTLNIAGLGNGEAIDQTLISVDEVIGNFGSVDINGLASNQNATLTIDYDLDEVILSLTAAGTGEGLISFDEIGNSDNAQSSGELWDALTNGHGIYSDDPTSSIPAEEDLDDVF